MVPRERTGTAPTEITVCGSVASCSCRLPAVLAALSRGREAQRRRVAAHPTLLLQDWDSHAFPACLPQGILYVLANTEWFFPSPVVISSS